MAQTRIPETDHGIQGTVTVAAYDEMQRHLREKGWIETQGIIKSGIQSGWALEIGHGPGYLGLEWLKNTRDTRLTGLDISPDMTALATQNARAYGFDSRTHFDGGCGNDLPYEEAAFESVFSSGSLHEWSDPQGTFNEILRVLKSGGLYFISDFRRDMPFFMRWLLWMGTRPASIRPYLSSSIRAAYTPAELKEMVKKSDMRDANVEGNLLDVIISGKKGRADGR
ncbi:MAG: class I SAM-dependent methyltransferase [Anaerolineaceae bacterium]|nr:class I SAM-dependent methyltransferase [Anaerolineaceae bacterium]